MSALRDFVSSLRGRMAAVRASNATEEHEFENSSNLARAVYNRQTRELTVTFKSGQTYTYAGVPPFRYYELRDARSAGQFFHRNIRTKFPFHRH